VAKEYWYFCAGAIAILIPLAIYVLIHKFDLLEVRPDQKIVYREVEGQKLALHVFKARGGSASDSSAALLLFHGGRWTYGSPKAFYPQCEYFAKRGITCVSASYRLGRDNKLDVRKAVDDARSALEYLIANARELAVNPQKIAVGGGSSGGHLAAMLGVSASLRSKVPNDTPAALILYNPMLDLSPCNPDHHLVADYWEEVSPYHHLSESVPPTLILLGSEDPELPLSTAQSFCDSVSDSHGRCELALYHGQSHGFFNKTLGANNYFELTSKRVLDFLHAELN